LKVHAAIARVLHATGMSEEIQSILRDDISLVMSLGMEFSNIIGQATFYPYLLYLVEFSSKRWPGEM
jgi:hypothetical protein